MKRSQRLMRYARNAITAIEGVDLLVIGWRRLSRACRKCSSCSRPAPSA